METIVSLDTCSQTDRVITKIYAGASIKDFNFPSETLPASTGFLCYARDIYLDSSLGAAFPCPMLRQSPLARTIYF
jgi:hypothetical protein